MSKVIAGNKSCASSSSTQMLLSVAADCRDVIIEKCSIGRLSGKEVLQSKNWEPYVTNLNIVENNGFRHNGRYYAGNKSNENCDDNSTSYSQSKVFPILNPVIVVSEYFASFIATARNVIHRTDILNSKESGHAKP